MKKAIFIFVVFSLLLSGCSNGGDNKDSQNVSEQNKVYSCETGDNIELSDKGNIGSCIFETDIESDSYAWNFYKSTCCKGEALNNEITKEDVVNIKKAFEAYYQNSAYQGGEIGNIVIYQQEDGLYAKGSVYLDREFFSTPYFLAAKYNGEWVVPVFSQDYPMCSDIEKYNFPVSMVSKCVDNDLGEVIDLK